jgi:hypothetical protein
MANRRRGEIDAELSGRTYRLCLTLGALAELEDAYGEDLLTIAERFELQTEGTDFSVDHTTGVVSFLPGREPAAGAAVTAGFEFDVPVRFDTDHLAINLTSFRAGDIPDIAIVEVRV